MVLFYSICVYFYRKFLEMKIRVLFVCLGNICRSPAAEGIFRTYLEREGLDDKIECDSAGISPFHIGESVDSRMQMHAEKRGYELDKVARAFNSKFDFDNFDFIIGMDDQNVWDLRAKARNDKDRKKIYKLTDFAVDMDYDSVPDPYYGGEAGFELALDILEDACDGLLQQMKDL